MENEKENKINKAAMLEREPIKKLLFTLSIPTVLAQLVNLLYNIVDRIYIGRIPGYGSLALAGLGVTFPILILISAFAFIVGAGGAPRAAIALGRKDHEEAERILGNSTALLLIFSLILTAIFYFSKDFILLKFGASAKTLPYASDYISIYLIGTIFVQLSLGLNMFITSQGFTKISMATVCIGALLNIVLDPIFIFGLDMGVKGAALATIISQAVSAIWVLAFLLGKKTILKLKRKNLRLSSKIVGSIISLGISPFIMQSTECLIQLTFNKGMLKYGGDMYVALMSILFSLTQVIWLPMQGFSQGAQPIISYNYGAKNIKRVKDTFKLLFKIMVGYAFIFIGIVELFPAFFVGIFSSDPEILAIGVNTTRVFLAGMAFMGAQSACQQTFLALGEAKISMFLALLRKIILLIPLALILPRVTGLGVWALLMAEPISDFLASCTTTVMFYLRSKKILR